MKEIVAWLSTIELSANTFYSGAAELFSDDPSLKTFCQDLAADEQDHYAIMTSAAKYLAELPPRKPQINIDLSLMRKIEMPFEQGLELLRSGSLRKESVIDIVVESEFSEWNHIFLYVLTALGSENRIYEQTAMRIYRHLRHIEQYLNTFEYGRDKLQAFTKLPYFKKEKALIVDDNPAIAQLLAALLEDICDCDLAANGAEALEKIRLHTYGLVITDIDMPVMNGLDLFKNAAPLFLNPADSFIFHSGSLTDTVRTFLEANHLTYMAKPSSISRIRETVISNFRLSPVLTV